MGLKSMLKKVQVRAQDKKTIFQIKRDKKTDQLLFVKTGDLRFCPFVHLNVRNNKRTESRTYGMLKLRNRKHTEIAIITK